MSDLCAPILAVVREEAAAFWCFEALMRRLEGSFNTDCACVPGFKEFMLLSKEKKTYFLTRSLSSSK